MLKFIDSKEQSLVVCYKMPTGKYIATTILEEFPSLEDFCLFGFLV
jgi:hypothetical protein